jgi:heme/copper-type cytochrome/quinol oxidase subunit 3
VLLLRVPSNHAESYLSNGLGLGNHHRNAALPLFAATGAHVAMVVVGMLFILLMGFRTLGGQYHSRDREGVAAAALFWYVSVALFGVLWYAIYVTK